MSPYTNCNYTFFFIFLVFIGGLIACNITDTEIISGEYLGNNHIVDNSTLNEHDRLFLIQMGEISLKMIALTRLGYERSKNNNLRALAKEFSSVHHELYDQASELARYNSVSFPLFLMKSDQLELNKLSAKSLNDFDSIYCYQMIREQTYMLETIRRFSDDASDTDVRAYARNYAHRLTEMMDQLTVLYKKE